MGYFTQGLSTNRSFSLFQKESSNYVLICTCPFCLGGPIRLMLMRQRLLRTHLPTKLITAAWVEEQRLGKGSCAKAESQVDGPEYAQYCPSKREGKHEGGEVCDTWSGGGLTCRHEGAIIREGWAGRPLPTCALSAATDQRCRLQAPITPRYCHTYVHLYVFSTDLVPCSTTTIRLRQPKIWDNKEK